MGYKSTMVGEPASPLPQVQKHGKTTIRRDSEGVTVEDESYTVGPRMPQPGEFDGNLAGNMDPSDRALLAKRLMEYRDTDMESRKNWEEREKRSLRMLGLDESQVATENEEITRAPGVHSVTHPMLLEACHQFAIRAYPELFPPEGLVKERIMGKKTRQRVEQAARVTDFMNFYLTVMDDGYYTDSDQMLYYLPMAGSAFRKAAPDFVTGLPQLRYVKATNFIAPYSGKELKNMPRYCHTYTMTGQDIDTAIENKQFAEIELSRPNEEAMNPTTEDTADSRTAHFHDDDHVHKIVEYHINLNLTKIDAKIDPLAAKRNMRSQRQHTTYPYIVVVEEGSTEILMIRRNWRENDKKCRKRVWFTHHKFLPGLGFYGFGYPHVIGSLGQSASGVVNALLDAGLAASMSGGFKTKEGRAINGDVRLEHGVWQDVDATAEELAKSFYTPPFNQPAPALFQLLEGLISAGQRFSGTTEVATGDAPNTAPVGTTLALQEEARKPQSAIHKRLCQSLGTELKMLHDLIYDLGPDQYPYEYEGEEKVFLKQDFDGRVDVIPVADPKVYSDTQRIQQGQAVRQVMIEQPALFGRREQIEAVRRLFVAMKIPDPESVLPQEQTPKYLDPVAENGMMLLAQAVKAFETQDHLSHIAVHKNGLQWALNSNADMKPEQLEQIEAAYRAHIREHQALYYRALVYQSAGLQAPPLDENGMPTEVDPKIEAQISAAVARALPQPPPPVEGGGDDGTLAKVQAAIQAKQMESEAAIERDTANFAAEQQRLETAFQNEERRKNMMAVNEQKRKDAAAKQDLANKQAAAAVDRENKTVSGFHEIARKDVAGESEQERKDRMHQQGLEHKDDQHAQKIVQTADQHELKIDQTEQGFEQQMSQGEQTHQQSLEHAEADQQQQIEQGAAAFEQETQQSEQAHKQASRHDSADHRRGAAHDEDDHARAGRHDEDEHARAMSHLEEDHERASEHADEDHEAELERGEESHEVTTQQAKESGKLKIEQARAVAKAKSAAAKKKAKKKGKAK